MAAEMSGGRFDGGGRKPIPTTVITGFLGTGKTTLIRHLLSEKPANELWAVLVNEFGPVGLDEAYLSEPFDKQGAERAHRTGIAVRMIPGGCICCDARLPLTVALRDIVNRIKPDRLLIEPTGLGHPTGVLDCLESFEKAGAIERRAVICLVDPGRLEEDRVRTSPVFIDQVQIADILVAAKCDLQSALALRAFDQLVADQFPPKSAVYKVSHGVVPLDVVDIPFGTGTPGVERTALFPDSHHRHGTPREHGNHDHGDHGHGDHGHGDHGHGNHGHGNHGQGDGYPEQGPRPGCPVRRSATDSDAIVCGWIFHQEDRFDLECVKTLLAEPARSPLAVLSDAMRIKAAVRTPTGAHRIERVGAQASAGPLAYRGSSRIEVILPAAGLEQGDNGDRIFQSIERHLLTCLVNRSTTRPEGACVSKSVNHP